MTFDEWWKSRYGNSPINNDNGGVAAMLAWDAATAAERERCAKAIEGFATDQPGIGITWWGEGLASHIRKGGVP